MEGSKAADHIVVIDDDVLNLKIAGRILCDKGMYITALNGGKALFTFLDRGNHPDLILLDIMMPEMDGFETLKRLREYEEENGIDEIPVIFMTADDDKEIETRGFSAGIIDFVRKPFEPEALVHRIKNVLSNLRTIQTLSEEVLTDKLTGLLNKESTKKHLERVCPENSGTLLMIDMDCFKLVNDLYGHEAGDRIIMAFSEILRSSFRAQDIVGRVGGDEFIAFLIDLEDENAIRNIVKRLNNSLKEEAFLILGENMNIPLGVSAGAVISQGGVEYETLLRGADSALIAVKQNGKHGLSIWRDDKDRIDPGERQGDSLKQIDMILEERNVDRHALWLGQENFGNIYRYMLRYIKRYNERAFKILFTLNPVKQEGHENEYSDEKEFATIVSRFGNILRSSLRNSDIMMQNGSRQFFLMLPMVSKEDIPKVIDRVFTVWEQTEDRSRVQVIFETEEIDHEDDRAAESLRRKSPFVVVVDDDIVTLKSVGKTLSANEMRVTALNSGKALLDYLEEGNDPDLILLDLSMPDMDGLEVLKAIRENERSGEEIPIIIFTGSEDEQVESKALDMGATDFMRKPFIPQTLVSRVKLSIELIRLQKGLAAEVKRKTSENKQMFLEVVQSLTAAIDAKDRYTNGHSGRVAAYSREIAKRCGYSEGRQDEIYMIGILHDVGKIGVPDEVINKPSRLTDEEFEVIKTHTVMGASILENIKSMPRLAAGARWHHERFSGGGYPDGLVGEDIPEEARIIAVADAYDAMTSFRSYRSPLSQSKVREEILNGSGTQFDPRFAGIMVDMIDEDIDFNMRENN